MSSTKMERMGDFFSELPHFFRVRKVLFISTLSTIGMVYLASVLVAAMPTSGWIAVPIVGLMLSLVGVGWGIWLLAAQLAVRKRLVPAKSVPYRTQIRKLRKSRVRICSSYLNAASSSSQRAYLDQIEAIDNQLEELTGRRQI